jgi:hypothetical protein
MTPRAVAAAAAAAAPGPPATSPALATSLLIFLFLRLIFFLLFLWRLLLLLRAAIFFDLKGRSQSVSTSFLAIRSAMVGLAWPPSNIAIYRYEKGVRGTPHTQHHVRRFGEKDTSTFDTGPST